MKYKKTVNVNQKFDINKRARSLHRRLFKEEAVATQVLNPAIAGKLAKSLKSIRRHVNVTYANNMFVASKF